MTQVEQIKTEIERLKNKYGPYSPFWGTGTTYSVLEELISFIESLNKEQPQEPEKEALVDKKDKERQDQYDRWWEIMHIPMCDITQEDLEWAATQDEFNSYQSKKNFEWEIERRKAEK